MQILNRKQSNIIISFASDNIKENQDEEAFYRIGLLAVTWFGDRIAL